MLLSESITGLRTLLDNAEREVNSLNSGRKASASRARLSLQHIKKSCHALRKDITTHTKAIPKKTRVKKFVEEPAVEPVEEPAEAVEPEPVAEKKVRKPRVKKNPVLE
jgi:hypothetical protein